MRLAKDQFISAYDIASVQILMLAKGVWKTIGACPIASCLMHIATKIRPKSPNHLCRVQRSKQNRPPLRVLSTCLDLCIQLLVFIHEKLRDPKEQIGQWGRYLWSIGIIRLFLFHSISHECSLSEDAMGMREPTVTYVSWLLEGTYFRLDQRSHKNNHGMDSMDLQYGSMSCRRRISNSRHSFCQPL